MSGGEPQPKLFERGDLADGEDALALASEPDALAGRALARRPRDIPPGLLVGAESGGPLTPPRRDASRIHYLTDLPRIARLSGQHPPSLSFSKSTVDFIEPPTVEQPVDDIDGVGIVLNMPVL